MGKNYHETELGKVPDSVKKVKLSKRTENILSGKHDDEPLNPETQVNNSLEFFLLAAKECGFETPEEIEENFEMIAFIASEMVKGSRDRTLTKFASNPNWIRYLAARYQSKVLANI